MMGTLSWLLTLACLAAGGAMLVHGLRDFSTAQLVTRRFREQLMPQQVRVGARDLMERFGRNVAGSEPVGELAGLLMQAGFTSPAAPFIFVGMRLILSLLVAGGAMVGPLMRHAVAPKDAALAFFVGFLVYRGLTI